MCRCLRGSEILHKNTDYKIGQFVELRIHPLQCCRRIYFSLFTPGAKRYYVIRAQRSESRRPDHAEREHFCGHGALGIGRLSWGRAGENESDEDDQ
jgi:hypothetical protein